MTNSISRRLMLALGSLALCGATSAYAQSYPHKPVKIVMPWNDGFPANSTRLFSQELAAQYGQAFVVEPKPGAGGEVAAKQVIGAPADGYTLLVTGSSITIRAATDDKNADGLRDLQPIAQITTTPYVIVAKTGKYKTFKNLLAHAKEPQARLNFASAGVGTGMHYLGELINLSAGVQMVHVPYNTGSKQLAAVMGGDVDIAIISLVTAWPHITAGTMEALAVSSAERSAVATNVPTLHELGFKDVPAIGAWIAVFGPKNLDPAIVKSLSEKITSIAKAPATQETVKGWAAELPDTSTAALTNVLRTETSFWRKLIKERNLPVAD
ncbi:Bug family tripartite tricarboxylate transporter substrate binding protein [Diaphorobacter caeni]|uniref:Bug family tripartite tricarboxylate transporter substrate binding protein n=1 Tax=Diaphorobacter caeni TaxID=2784387 RepID=UPI00188EB6E9|nr:tripartite tricarboxylate transporter substrate binding protein [Diaphorobacter caeni]MBF5007237.1 tripartite tricarboxylate transporter substrate binding protein [Diaphorobacter caeni]